MVSSCIVVVFRTVDRELQSYPASFVNTRIGSRRVLRFFGRFKWISCVNNYVIGPQESFISSFLFSHLLCSPVTMRKWEEQEAVPVTLVIKALDRVQRAPPLLSPC